MIPPGATLGILGAGQLGKMLALAAQRLGYRVHAFDADAAAPGLAVAHERTVAAFADADAVAAFAAKVDVLTFEFENVEAGPLAALTGRAPVRPAANVLAICQHRLREKRFLAGAGLPHVPYRALGAVEPGLDVVPDVAAAVAALGLPCVLKTAASGYDGKGQRVLRTAADVAEADVRVRAGGGYVAEAWVDFAAELSVLTARSPDGAAEVFLPVAENEHEHHILARSILPGRFSAEVAAAARSCALRTARALDLCGLLAVEMFLSREGHVWVNELAPRPHNSGHASLEACRPDQFELHLRAVCGLPLPEPVLQTPAVMVNLLGELWREGRAPDWRPLLRDPSVHLHLYGKSPPRRGRKMGHFTVTAASTGEALRRAHELAAELGS